MADVPSDINATIVVGKMPQVEIEELPVHAVPTSAKVAPISVNIYKFTVNHIE